MGKLGKLCLALVAIGPLLTIGSPQIAASASSKVCHVSFQGQPLQAPKGGGARLQTYTVEDDCSVSAGPVKHLLPGTPEFRSFAASHGSRRSGTLTQGATPSLITST